MRFALVIPALNEEAAIAGTLRRALAARAKVCAATPVTAMQVVFVNDGCTDRTQEIVDQPEFRDVIKVAYGRNRGYGAAIKAGWQAADADLVGFIDADGTCDPDFCIQLVNTLVEQNADVVLAARLNPNSEMPLVRKIGNTLFATLLGVVSGQRNITDTASGFRVVRRSSLRLMSPLPDGLHFTPAMSCICLLDPRLRIAEVNGMHYKEREGRSKLSVIKDGFRFLFTILFSAACYAPLKTMLAASGLVVLATLAALGVLFAAGGPRLALTATGLAGALTTVFLLSAGVVCHELNFLLIGPRRQVGPAERLLQRLLDYSRLIYGGVAVTVAALAGLVLLGLLAHPGLQTSLALMALVLLAACGSAAAIGGIIIRVIWAVGQKQSALIRDEYRTEGGKGQESVVRSPETTAAVPQMAVTR